MSEDKRKKIIYSGADLEGGRVRANPPTETQRCTCPSGDGSLRWPCPAHPPEASTPVKVPKERFPVGAGDYGWRGAYNTGWNECRATMLAGSPQPPAETQPVGDCGEAGHDEGRCGNASCTPPSGPVGVELLCRVYADAYLAGHHATVEGGYVDVLPVDRDTYWREKVEDDYADELAQQPVATVSWRDAFIAEREQRYRSEGMKIEQARIHAETDAALMEPTASQKPAAVDGVVAAIRKLARDMKLRSLDGATRSALWYSDDLREYADRLLALAAQQGRRRDERAKVDPITGVTPSSGYLAGLNAALRTIAAIEAPDTAAQMNGHEDAYRAVEALAKAVEAAQQGGAE